MDTDPKKLFEENDGQIRKQRTNKISANISGDFGEYYNQNDVKIRIDLDGPKLQFFIYDKDEVIPFKPQQRSKGFQWFLSFFLTLNAEGQDNIIVLVDEPGLYLHAKAQQDILNILERIPGENQVVFTTHSPYLINPNRLDRVRLVIKDDKNYTYVENSVHKGADKDTMTPVITAIGLDLTTDLTFSPISNILVEGMSDYYYLQAMREYLGNQCPIGQDVRFIPNVGADQIPNMAALLFGWGVNFKVLLDHDDKGIAVAKRLRDDLNLEDDRIEFVHNDVKSTIEDLFSAVDFIRYILPKELPNTEGKNSRRMRCQNKVMLSKSFCSMVFNKDLDNRIQLDLETVDNFKKLFERLKVEVKYVEKNIYPIQFAK